MNCGIEVLKRLNDCIDIDLNEAIKECETKVTEKGLSMYDMKNILSKYIKCKAIASLKLIKQTPYIAFIGPHSLGHYVLVEKVDKYVWVYDPACKLKKCHKLYFYFIWSKKSLIFMV